MTTEVMSFDLTIRLPRVRVNAAQVEVNIVDGREGLQHIASHLEEGFVARFRLTRELCALTEARRKLAILSLRPNKIANSV